MTQNVNRPDIVLGLYERAGELQYETWADQSKLWTATLLEKAAEEIEDLRREVQELSYYACYGKWPHQADDDFDRLGY